MICPSDYSVHPPEGHPEVTGLVPISQKDERFNRRQPPRNRRKRREPTPAGPAAPAARPTEPSSDDLPRGEGDQHVIDALA